MKQNLIQIEFWHEGKTITIDIELVDIIGTLKIKIQCKLGIHPEYQELIYNGKILQDNKTLTDYNIKKKETIRLIQKKKKGFIIFVANMQSR